MDDYESIDPAKAHAAWYAKHFMKIVEIVYEDAFNHGLKHGKEEARKKG